MNKHEQNANLKNKYNPNTYVKNNNLNNTEEEYSFLYEQMESNPNLTYNLSSLDHNRIN